MSWSSILGEEKSKPYFNSILNFLENEIAKGKIIYPSRTNLFAAFKETPYQDLKIVILGQDPYHGPGQAHGLAFSVTPPVKPPPSLVNIFKELNRDIGVPIPTHGYLKKWANQGVLLLNTCLSVEKGKPYSHAQIGWDRFTDTVITQLNNYPHPLVFLLWGAHAQKKRMLINEKKHLILTSSHPSPLSVHQGFKGCGHFSKANEFIVKHGGKAIDWSL